MAERVRKFQKTQSKQDTAGAVGRAEELLASAERIGDTAIVAGSMGEVGADQLRAAADSVRAKAGSAAALFAAIQGDRVVLLAAMSEDVVKRGVKAGDLIREIAPIVGGKGGGRPDMAQGGGTDTTKIEDVVSAAREWLKGKLG
jgi:alanyl-tRNA synthetase